MTTTEYVWADLSEIAIRRFHDVPSNDQEARIIEVFQRRPELVAQAIDHVASRFEQGLVSNPWAFLTVHVEKAAAPGAQVRAQDSGKRDRAVRVAEQWLHAAGLHFDRQSELEDELFGERGMLRDFHPDDALRERLLTLWAELRDRREQIEREADERGRRHVDWRRQLVAADAARKANAATVQVEEGVAG